MSINPSLNISFDDDEDYQSESYSQSQYYNIEQFCALELSPNSIFCSVLNLNARSLLKKLDELILFLDIFSTKANFLFDVITIEETWLDKNNESLAVIPGYNLITKNKELTKIGGGVCMFIRNNINYKTRLDLFDICDNSKYDGLFVEIGNNESKKNIIIGVLYRSPSYNTENEFTDKLKQSINTINNENCECIICGDMNIDLLKYNVNPSVDYYLDMLLSNSFIPEIHLPTRVTECSKSLIDHVFKKMTVYESIAGTMKVDLSDHYVNFILYKNKENVKEISKKNMNFREITENNIQKLNEKLSNMNWNILTHYNSIDEAYDLFLQKYTDAINESMPVRNVKFNRKKHKICPWITSGIIKSINTKNKLYQQYQKTKEANAKAMRMSNYKNYRNYLNKIIRQAKKVYMEKIFNNSIFDSKRTWKNINVVLNRTKNKSDIPNSFEGDLGIVEGKENIANEFNKYFVNTGKRINQKLGPASSGASDFLKDPLRNSLFFNPTNEQEIISIVQNMKSKNSSGFDSINSKIIKHTIHSLIPPLLYLINLSLSTGKFPAKMKIAKVLPVYKAKDKNRFVNYRPISLLPVFSKILEKIVHNRLYKYCVKYNIITPSQYGFRKNHSTEHALIEFQNRIVKLLNEKQYCISVFMDLSKAFDSIDHSILLKKLYHIGIRGITYNWFESYLSDRSQYVNILDINSEHNRITCGVPQGSILGPLLFIVYINDIIQSSKLAHFIMYADDTNVIFTDKSLCSLEKKVNTELSNICNWLVANKLLLNIDKTKFMYFQTSRKKHAYNKINIKINSTIIEQVEAYKFLGVYVDERLNWKTHLSEKAKQISRTVGVMNKLKFVIPQSTLRIIYISLVESQFMYGISVWGKSDMSNYDRLNILQKRAIRIISRSKYNSHTEPLFKALCLLKLEDIYQMNCIRLYCSFLKCSCPNYIINAVNFVSKKYSTRQSHCNYMLSIKNNLDKQLLNYKLSDTWNKIPVSLQEQFNNMSTHAFIKKIKLHFISRYKDDCLIDKCYICKN